MSINDYLALLPVVQTATLPLGALFWAENRIYEVVQVDGNGYNKARQWRKDEKTDVALVPNTPLAQRMRVIAKGQLIPPIRSRNEFLKDGRYQSYVFPIEQNALDAAYLDTALLGRGSGIYVRRRDRYPAFEITNGVLVLRCYYFMRTNQGIDTTLADIKHRLSEELISHRQGPMYWRLLPSWDESPYDLNQTVAMRPLDLEHIREELEKETKPITFSEDESFASRHFGE